MNHDHMTRRLRRTIISSSVAALAAVTTLAGCDAKTSDGAGRVSPGDDGRGSIVTSSKVAELDVADVKRTLDDAGFASEHAQLGVTAYRIVYRTVDIDGEETRASGLLVIPATDRRELQAVSYTHGTTTFKGDVASEWTDDYTTSPGLMYASAGYVAVLPDYLGLGQGPGIHPWMHMATQTSASLDMLRASRTLVAEEQHTMARNVLVTGFSQGASAALGLARALQDGDEPDFTVSALAPISGAYDFAGAELPALLGGRLDVKSSAIYAGLMLTSWDRSFDLYDDPRDVFQEPYADKVAEVFDGTTTGDKMFATMPDTVDQLLTDRGRQLLQHPSGHLVTALRQADTACRWSPDMPTRLYVAQEDEQAATPNTERCLATLRGSQVVDLGRPDHFHSRHIGSNLAGTAAALEWFLSMSAPV